MQNRISVYVLLFAALVFMGACNDGKTKSTTTTRTDSIAKDTDRRAINTDTAKMPGANITDTDENGEDYAKYYILVLDTGTQYYPLMREMYATATAMHCPIDTMNRHYDRKKDDIVVADDDEDEMYRGEYYPRRETGSFLLSLEYNTIYIRDTKDKTIALVAGISETTKEADSLLHVFKPYAPHAFVETGYVYAGCMH